MRSVMLPVASRTAHAAERLHTERQGVQVSGQNDRFHRAPPWIAALTNADGNAQIGNTSYQDSQQGPFRDGCLGVLAKQEKQIKLQHRNKSNCDVMDSESTFRSPEMLAPARMPVAAGKNMENTEKNDSPLRKSGVKFSKKILPLKKKHKKSLKMFFHLSPFGA